MSTQQLRNVATGTQVAKPAGFPAMIEQLKKQCALALPKHLNADRMARIALTEFNKNKALADCDPRSVFASVVMASQLGLEPGVMGQAYLIPYGGVCTFVPGWQGLVDIVQRSGRASVWTGAVFEGDDFDYEYGSKPYISHRPGDNDGIPEKLTHVYAVGQVSGSPHQIIEVWKVAKVLRHRDRFNKVGKRHYSFQHFEMYARKVVLLQVLKYLPKSVELATAVNLEHDAQAGAQNIALDDAITGTFVPMASDEPSAEPAGDTPKDEIAPNGPEARELDRRVAERENAQ